MRDRVRTRGDGRARARRRYRGPPVAQAPGATRTPGAAPREALPQRVRWSRIEIASGATFSAAACRSMARRIASRARARSHASRTSPTGAPVGEGESNVQLVLEVATDTRHDGATRSRGSVDAQPMELAPVAERRPVAQPAAGRECRALGRLPGEMAAEPRLTLAEERRDQRFGARPASSVRARDRDHDAFRGVDDDAHRPRLR